MAFSILIFILVLSVLVLVHEAGHFFAARRGGVLVEEFGFGLPPKVWGKKIGETIYSINLLPFGGFVRLHGENSDESLANPKRAFLTQSKKKRSIIILAGVFMNFVLAVVAFSLVYSFTGIPKETGRVKAVEIRPDSPAANSGIEIGDVVIKVDQNAVTTNEEFINYIENKKGQEITLVIEREGRKEPLKLTATPRTSPPEGEGALGVIITSTEAYFPPLWQRPFVGIYYGFQEAIFWGGIVIGGFIKIFTDLFGGVVPKDVAGPIGIFALTSEAAKFGILTLINFVGILSVNLAILNIIPFPALDGGRLLFIGIEKIRSKPVPKKIEAVVNAAGFALLIMLM